jgi:hypothetical protein
MSGFNTRPIPYIIFVLIVFVLVMTALKLRSSSIIVTPPPLSARGFGFIVFISLAAGIAWFGGLDTVFMPQKIQLWIAMAGAPILAILYLSFAASLISFNSNRHRLAVVSGLLTAEMLFGFFVTSKNKIDHFGHVLVMVLILVLLLLLYKKTGKQEQPLLSN